MLCTVSCPLTKEYVKEALLAGWFVLIDTLLSNGDEPNLILPKFARPLYSFSHQLFGTCRSKYF